MVRAIVFEKGKGVRELPVDQLKKPGEGQLLWVDLEEPDDEEAALLSTVFEFHDLAIEDCLTLNHQPKIDHYGSYVFIVARAILEEEDDLVPGSIGLYAFLGRSFLVTFHRSPLHSINQTIEKCKINPKTISRGIDFLYHATLDAAVDRYFPILHRIEHEIEGLEELVLGEKATMETYTQIFHLKTELARLERAVNEQMKVVSALERGISELVSRKTANYYGDIYDNLMRIRNILYLYRDNLVTTFDVSVNLSSHRTNEIMRVLTIIATIMMPLTVITGFYGMNFVGIAEFKWKYGHLLAIGIMVIITVAMLIFFRKKKWI